VSRNLKIEEILTAWFEADHCSRRERAISRRRRDEVIKKYIGKDPFTVEQVLDCLHSQYQEYRRDRKRQEKLSGGQQAPKRG